MSSFVRSLSSLSFLFAFAYAQILSAAISVSWPKIGGTSYSVPQAGETGWANLTNYLVALQNAQGTTSQTIGVRTATTSPVTVSSANDTVIVVKLSVPGASTVNLPAGFTGQYFAVVDGTGDAGSNNITIDPSGSQTINGASTYVIKQNRKAVLFIWNGTEWSIFAEFGSSSLAGSNGILVQTGTDTFAARTIAAGSSKLSVTDGNGISGNPTLDVVESNLTLNNFGGTLGISKGGTGQTAKSAAFNALSPVTTKADLITSDGTNNVRLGIGADTFVLTADSAQTTGVKWAAVPSGFTNPMSGAGELIYGGTGGTPTARTAGTAGQIFTANGAAAPTWNSVVALPGASGTTSTPSYGWDGTSANTGFYLSATDAVGLSSNGTQSWNVSASGAHRVGPAVTNNATGQIHTYSGSVFSSNVTSTADSGEIVFGDNARINGTNGVIAGRTDATSGGGAAYFSNPTTASNPVFSVLYNAPSDTTSTNAQRGFFVSATGANTFGPAVTGNSTGQRHIVNGSLFAGNVTSTASSGEIIFGTNTRITSANSQAGRTDSTSGGGALYLANPTTSTNPVAAIYYNPPGDATSNNATRAMLVTGQGAITFDQIHNVGTGNITSGRYTPTPSALTNLTSISASSGLYSRVGNVVTVSGTISVQQTTSGTTCEFRLSLPIVSNLTAGPDLTGTGGIFAAGVNTSGIIITADTTSDIAVFNWRAQSSSTVVNINFVFQYEVKP